MSVDPLIEIPSQRFKASIVRAVPLSPSDYYSKVPIPDAQQLEVPAGRVGFINIQAEEGQRLSWKIQTDGHFAYAVFYSADPNSEDISQMTPVYPRFNVCVLETKMSQSQSL